MDDLNAEFISLLPKFILYTLRRQVIEKKTILPLFCYSILWLTKVFLVNVLKSNKALFHDRISEFQQKMNG